MWLWTGCRILPGCFRKPAPGNPVRHKLLFAVNLGVGGMSLGFAGSSLHFLHPRCLENCTGSVVVDGEDELFTKKGRKGNDLHGQPVRLRLSRGALVEATGSLYNFNIRARIQASATRRPTKTPWPSWWISSWSLTGFRRRKGDGTKSLCSTPAAGRPPIPCCSGALSGSSWNQRPDPGSEPPERHRVDCRGCSYEACLHFGEQGDCFYGGVMVEEGYPAIRESDTLVFACPNYNDAVSANIMAFFNRMTALFRTDYREFAKKRIFALVVSGYSGGDIVAEQVIDALNCNKHFILPPHFALMETANDPGSILQNQGLEQRVKEMARRIAGREFPSF